MVKGITSMNSMLSIIISYTNDNQFLQFMFTCVCLHVCVMCVCVQVHNKVH